MSLLFIGKYKEPITRLPEKLPNINSLSVPSSTNKNVINSGNNPISTLPANIPARTINIFNDIDKKEPKQERVNKLLELFLQVKKNEFIKNGVIQQAFKPDKHSNFMNYLNDKNPNRAKEKMINSIQEALNNRSYNQEDGTLSLTENATDVALTAEQLKKADPNLDSELLEKQLEDVKKNRNEEMLMRERMEETGFTPQTPAQKRYIGEIVGADNLEQLTKVFKTIRRGTLDKPIKNRLYDVIRDRFNQFKSSGALETQATDKDTEEMLSIISTQL